MTRSPLVVCALLLAVTRAGAQTASPAHISVVEGAASIARLSGSENAEPDVPLEPGDRVGTADGRLEIVTGDGAVIHLDAQSAVDVNAAGVIRLLGGRLIVASAPDFAGALQVDTSPASVRLSAGSEGRLSLFRDAQGVFLDVAMVRGDAEIVTGASGTTVIAGSQVVVREGDGPSDAMAFNSAEVDAFSEWSNALLDSRRGTTSAGYLPADLTGYGAALDESGSWSYLAPYGYVWYPRVEPGWRPYYHGRWCWRDGIGWNFVGGSRWTWPTHHYGRWGVAPSGAWYWIPGTTWSSAWVQWAVAPGYVSWCPLGSNNRPVGRFWADRAEGHHAGEARGWTVVRTSTFGTGAQVSRHAVDARALIGPTAPAFVVQNNAPRSAAGRGSFGVAGRSLPPAEAQVAPQETRGAVPRSSRVMTTDGATAPPVVYYRGGTVTAGESHQTRGHERAGDMPRYPAHEPGRSPGHEPGRDAHATRGFVVPGTQPPPIPYRDGPPIIAVPRATAPGFRTGPPVIAGPPPVPGAPAGAIGAPPAHPATPVVRPAPVPHPAPAPPPAPAPQATPAPASHGIAAPRSGPR